MSKRELDQEIQSLELDQEIQSLELDVDDLENLPTANPAMAAQINLWSAILKHVVKTAKEIGDKPKQTEDMVEVLRLIVLLANGWKQSVCLFWESGRKTRAAVRKLKKSRTRKS